MWRAAAPYNGPFSARNRPEKEFLGRAVGLLAEGGGVFGGAQRQRVSIGGDPEAPATLPWWGAAAAILGVNSPEWASAGLGSPREWGIPDGSQSLW